MQPVNEYNLVLTQFLVAWCTPFPPVYMYLEPLEEIRGLRIFMFMAAVILKQTHISLNIFKERVKQATVL